MSAIMNLLREFPNYEAENGPMKTWGWTVLKRRRIREQIKIKMEDDKMQYGVNAARKPVPLQKIE